MLYDIGLRISYAYETPANTGRHLLRVMPIDLDGRQRMIAGALHLKPTPTERSGFRDFYGNEAVEVVYRSAHDTIEISLKARIQRDARESELDMSPQLSALAAEVSARLSLDPQSPHHFLGASPRVKLNPAMTEYAEDAVSPDMTALEAVRAVGMALHRDMRFDAKATTVDTPAEEAFANRHGVCQDFTHIMIACLRGLGVPAGYVSGFLRTLPPPGRPRLEGADAMHAWVRAWCGAKMGWIEFDPTNAINAGVDHITIAHGRDYSDVAPIKGVLRSAGSHTSKQAVDVVPVE